MIKKLAVLAIVAALSAASLCCASYASNTQDLNTSQKRVFRLLHSAGYHDAQILFESVKTCGNHVRDFNSAYFRSISPNDHIVEGFVCDQEISIKRMSQR